MYGWFLNTTVGDLRKQGDGMSYESCEGGGRLGYAHPSRTTDELVRVSVVQVIKVEAVRRVTDGQCEGVNPVTLYYSESGELLATA